MGLVLCNKHSSQGLVINIHETLLSKIRRNIKIENDELEIIFEELILEDEGLDNETLKYLVTKNFLKENNLSTKYRNNSDDINSFMMKVIYKNMGSICGKCLNQYLNYHELNIGKFYKFLSNK